VGNSFMTEVSADNIAMSSPNDSLAALRKSYERAELDETRSAEDPLQQFERWLTEAIDARLPEPNAMTLATVGGDLRPSTRIVLIKGYDARGIVWFTNYQSRKGQELAGNPFAALQFHWVELERVDIPLRVFPAVDCALHHVPELADVSGPVVGFQLGDRLGREAGPIRPIQLDGHPAPEMIGEKRNVAAPSPKRRKGDDFERQAVEQVRAEIADIHLHREVRVGRRDDTDIDGERLGGADPSDFTIFDGAEEPVLSRHGKRTEFVQEEGSAIGLFEAAVPGLGRAGEAARLVAEELGLDQCLRQRRAVHDDQRTSPARRQVMKALGDQFLAGSAFSNDKDRAVERRRTARPLDGVEECQALPHELICPLHYADNWCYTPSVGKIFR